MVDLPENFHRIRPSAAYFRVPEQKALWPNVTVDEAADGRAERLLLVGADPNEVPGWKPAAVSTQT